MKRGDAVELRCEKAQKAAMLILGESERGAGGALNAFKGFLGRFV
jgi:hypothetical protein